jgi:alpha-D-xyloside xylohydrolase
MLNRGIGGVDGLVNQIGGYFDFGGRSSREAFERWTEWATLSPLFFLHNGIVNGTSHA